MRDARAQLEKVENLITKDLGEISVERAAQGQGTLSGNRLGVALRTANSDSGVDTSSESWQYTSPSKVTVATEDSDESMGERGI